LVIARILGADSFGDYIYVLTWVTSLTIFGKLGFDVASIRFVAAYVAKKEWGHLSGFLKRITLFVLVLSLTFGAGLILGIYPISDFIGLRYELINTFWISSPLLTTLAMVQVQGGMLRGFGKVAPALAPEAIFYPLLLIIFVTILWLFDPKPDAPAVMTMNVCSALLVLILQRWFLVKASVEDVKNAVPIFRVKEWLRTAAPMALTSGSQTLLRQVDILMVGAMMGTRQAPVQVTAMPGTGTAGVLPRQTEISVPLGHAAWEQSLTRQVLQAGQGQLRQLHIKLNPSNLGSIDIKLQVEGDSTNIAFSSQHAVVREAVEASLPRLREMFSGSGINLGNVDVGGQDTARGQEREAQGGEFSPGNLFGGGDEGEQGGSMDNGVQSRKGKDDNQLLDYYV